MGPVWDDRCLEGFKRRSLACVIFMLVLTDPHLSAAEPRFETEVLPIFQAKCLSCHGEKGRKADLDLRSQASILKGGDSGPAVVPNKPLQSLLYEKVHQGAMPPGKKNRLSEAEVAVIRRWIETGAPSEASTAPAVTHHDVVPILLRRCTVCHGPRVQENGLDLRTKAAMLKGGKSGPVIVPGKPEKSLLIEKIRAGAMPPLRRLVEVSIKPIEPAETEMLTRWIALGAPEVALEPDVATTEPDPLVTDRDRDFWAFQPPKRPPRPAVRAGNRVRNPIDAFILQKLEGKELTLSAEADRLTLLRRVSFDLTGLPPSPQELEAARSDQAENWYEKVVDRLLASERYGERWGRHWLDVAGYADSEGKTEQDLPRPFAYRYRDYVIRAFNADKPYDRFLIEQIAGDELADYESCSEITPTLYDNLVATGFLRMAPDATWSNISNFIPDRFDVLADEIDVLGSAVLGLTLKCARCHSHKFDPIPQRDYYRLLDIFKGAFDEHDWMKSNWHPTLSMGARTDRDLPFVTSAERKQWEAGQAALQKEIDAIKAEKSKIPSAELDKRLKDLESRRQPEPRIRALWDRGEPSPTYLYRRGDYLSPGRLVGPGVPAALTDGKTPFVVKPPWPGAKKTGRRLAFAHWLTKPDHPLTARVMINRIWKHHFGAGLVRSLDNFGKAGARPTHPELLDWLAVEFVSPSPPGGGAPQATARAWSIKAMHRLMVTSATYRQSSTVTAVHEKLDADNALYSRMPLQRLSAEQLYDTLLLIAGRLDETRYGPTAAVNVRPDGLVTPVGGERGWRRGVYLRQQRKVVVTHLENFDFPQMNPNCTERRDSTVAPQALYLMNNGMIHELAEHFARRLRQEAGEDMVRQIETAYRIAFGRPPTPEEKDLGRTTLARITEVVARKPEPGVAAPREPAAHRALAAYCHVLMNSAEFLYVD